MVSLESCCRQFIFARHPFARSTGNGRSAVGRAAGYFIDPNLSLERIGQVDNNKPMMQK